MKLSDRPQFKHSAVTGALGVPARMLIHWADIGVAEASGGPSGKGSSRRYSERDVARVALIQALRRSGIDLVAMRAGAWRDRVERVLRLLEDDEVCTVSIQTGPAVQLVFGLVALRERVAAAFGELKAR